jgi:hypothetical protein
MMLELPFPSAGVLVLAAGVFLVGLAALHVGRTIVAVMLSRRAGDGT